MQTFFDIVVYIGIVAFSVSGAMVAIDKEADLFGVLLMSVVTTFAGGVMRDLFLGNTPLLFFSHFFPDVFLSLVSAAGVFLFALAMKRKYLTNRARMNEILNYFDALGLGLFAVMGTEISISLGHTGPFIAISMGLITGIGGGIVRDLCLGSVPFVIKKRIYAVAALLGAGIYYLLDTVFVTGAVVATVVAALTTFTLRSLATIFKWNMPKAIVFSELDEGKK